VVNTAAEITADALDIGPIHAIIGSPAQIARLARSAPLNSRLYTVVTGVSGVLYAAQAPSGRDAGVFSEEYVLEILRGK